MGLLLAGPAVPAFAQTTADAQPADVRLTDARLDTLLERGGREDLEEATSVYLDLLFDPLSSKTSFLPFHYANHGKA